MVRYGGIFFILTKTGTSSTDDDVPDYKLKSNNHSIDDEQKKELKIKNIEEEEGKN